MKKHSQHIINKILNSDLNSTELSQILNIPASSIRRIRNKNEIYIKKIIPENKIIELYKEYKNINKVSEILEIDRHTISKYLNKNNIITNKKIYLSEEDINYILDNYENYTAISLSKKFNCSKSLISKIWYKNGFNGKLTNKYKLNTLYFKNIDTPEKAYFLGLIIADGCLYKRNDASQGWLSISLQKKDEHILYEFLKELDCNKPIYHTQTTTKKGALVTMSSLQIVSEEIFKDLQNLGLEERKTWTCKFPKIKNELEKYMVRGFFDGDGGVTISKTGKNKSDFQLTFCGNVNTMKYIHDTLTSEDIKHNFRKCSEGKYSQNFYTICIFSIRDIYKFYNIFYTGAESIKLKRKQNRFEDFLDLNQKLKKWVIIKYKRRVLMNNLYFAKVNKDAILPTKNIEDAGFDLYGIITEDIVIKPGEIKMIGTGIATAFSDKYYLQLQERGSTGTKGLSLRCGVIDSGFRNEIFVPINNTSNKGIIILKDYEDRKTNLPLCYEDYIIYPDTKAICQAVLLIVPKVEVKEISYDELLKIKSNRGLGQLGSSGK